MFLKTYLVALLIFLAIDMVWLTIIAKDFYKKHIGFLMNETVNITPAVIFYVLFVLALVVFVITPSIEKNSWVNALMFGAFFGLVTYATYDLTNHATLKNWPLIVTLVDLAWGAFIGSAVSVITFFIISKI